MIKNVVFDLGGVVVNWNAEQLLAAYPGDKELPEALFKRGFFEQYWIEFDRGTVTQAELAREMGRFAGRAYEECWEFMEFVKHFLTDIPETCALIKELAGRGYRLFCLSNMSVEYYNYLKVREVFSYFEGHLISALEHLVKPDPAIYRLLLGRYGLQAGETLFIDDLKANVDSAARVGLHTVHFADRGRGLQEIRALLQG